MQITEWKEAIWKGYVLRDSNYMILLKGKTTETAKRELAARS